MWDRFVDFVTVVWLTLLLFDLANPNIILNMLNWVLLTVFIADVGIKYRREHNFKTFVGKR